MKTKRCIKCNTLKPLRDYYKTKLESYGYRDYYCKYCRTGANIISQNNKTKKCSIEECNRSHYAKTWCRVHYARWFRTGSVEKKMNKVDLETTYEYKNKKSIYKRKYLLQRNYKMSLEEYVERSKQGCEVCGVKPTDRNLHVDHDHTCCNSQISCGKCVRGILCNRCNVAVDKYESNRMRPDYPLLTKIQDYLEVYHAKNR